MKFKLIVLAISFLYIAKTQAIQQFPQKNSSTTRKSQILDPDSVLEAFAVTVSSIKSTNLSSKQKKEILEAVKTIEKISSADSTEKQENILPKDSTILIPEHYNVKVSRADSLLFLANPLLIELVYKGLPYKFNWDAKPDFSTLLNGKTSTTLTSGILKPIPTQTPTQIITDLRQAIRDEITAKAAYLYVATFDELPDPDGNKNYYIKERPFKKVKFIDDDDEFKSNRHRLIVHREQMGPWQYKATAMAQFSESVVSGNWYQGGNSNIAILGIMTGQLSYHHKDIQWDNTGEWHMGFNSVAGDTLRMLSTNDDIFKINSKLGVKAKGNFFYSASVDFSTQFFNSYNGINSTVMKTSFLTPIRLNIGIGLDYKYKNILSLMVAPVSYKYIYVSDNVKVNPNLFGVKTGEKVLSVMGSSFKAVLSYPLTPEIQLDSNLSFFTDCSHVEIDWEMVCNLTINRFLSTRISFNPRYDNTVIETGGSIAKMQLKQLVSVGFAHKFN